MSHTPNFIPLDQLHFNVKNITNKRFGRLIALGIVGRKHGGMVWFCQCDCGNTHTVLSAQLTAHLVQSCGCIHSERMHTLMLKHGQTGSPTHLTWCSMRDRCNNSAPEQYKRFGGAGISVSPHWDTFEQFYKDMGNRPEGLHLIRKDTSKNYSKKNCFWGELTSQTTNRKTNHFLTYQNHTRTISEWSKIVGIPASTIWSRIEKHNWSIEKSLTVVPISGGPKE